MIAAGARDRHYPTMTNGEEITTTPPRSRPDANPRLAVAALACVWFSIASVVAAMGLMLAVQGSNPNGVLLPMIQSLLLLQVPAAIALLVLSILCGMWGTRLDSAVTAVLLVAVAAADLMLWPIAASPSRLALGACLDTCGSGTTNADLWTGVGIQTLVLALLLVCSAHWLWRLRPDESDQKSNRLVVLAVAAVFVVALAAIDANIDTSSSPSSPSPFNSGSGFGTSGPTSAPTPSLAPTGKVTLSNDLGQTVRVVYCPQRNCTGQHARAMDTMALATFTTYGTAQAPDSFVVLDGPNGPSCATVGKPGDGHVLLSSADSGACDTDLTTLSVPQ